MLVLSRKKGEKLAIGPNITIEILGVEGDRVRVGIDAPKEVRIFRKELLEETIDINKTALSTPVVDFFASGGIKQEAQPVAQPNVFNKE